MTADGRLAGELCEPFFFRLEGGMNAEVRKATPLAGLFCVKRRSRDAPVDDLNSGIWARDPSPRQQLKFTPTKTKSTTQRPLTCDALESYNAIARRLGQSQAATAEEIVAALANDVTFSRIGHLRFGLFTAGQHRGSTTFWLQGNPLTSYGQRVGRHELTHLGAALRGAERHVSP